MSGLFFDDAKNLKDDDKSKTPQSWSVYETKLKYVGKVTGFLEKWVKEMRKDIKKL